MFHFENAISNYNLTLRIDKRIVTDINYLDSTEIKARLVPIYNSSKILKAVKDQNSNSLNFDGSIILNYYPRWFPESYAKMYKTLFQEIKHVPNFRMSIKNTADTTR